MKSEPDEFSIDDLQKNKTTLWEGVRNYLARNYMMNEMQPKDLVLFYHSNANPSGVIGIAEVSSKAVPDPSQFDAKSSYYDPKSDLQKPRWYCVEVSFLKKLPRLISLDEIRKHSKLAKMGVLKKGNRLSIQPVTKVEYEYFCQLD
jgi:predicted RNA-binding protein with PUA-like domain